MGLNSSELVAETHFCLRCTYDRVKELHIDTYIQANFCISKAKSRFVARFAGHLTDLRLRVIPTF